MVHGFEGMEKRKHPFKDIKISICLYIGTPNVSRVSRRFWICIFSHFTIIFLTSKNQNNSLTNFEKVRKTCLSWGKYLKSMGNKVSKTLCQPTDQRTLQQIREETSTWVAQSHSDLSTSRTTSLQKEEWDWNGARTSLWVDRVKLFSEVLTPHIFVSNLTNMCLLLYVSHELWF